MPYYYKKIKCYSKKIENTKYQVTKKLRCYKKRERTNLSLKL